MKGIRWLVSIPVIIMISLQLTGCTKLIALATPLHQLTCVIKTSADLNAYTSNKGKPLVLTFYQLRGTSKFNSVSFFDLYDNPSKSLGNTLITQQQLEVLPNKSIKLNIPLTKNAKYLGIVAAYHDLDNSQWRKLIKIKSTWGNETVNVTLTKNGIILGDQQ